MGRSRRVEPVAIALLAAGCGADPPLAEVHGVRTELRAGSPNQTTPVPGSLASYTLRAYVPDDSATGFRVIDAGITATAFTIPGVPAGSYYLAVTAPGATTPSFYQTTARSLEIGGVVVGRGGAVATRPTPLSLRLTGASAAAPGDRIYVDSFASGGGAFEAFPDTPAALDPYVVDWQTTRGALLDAAMGDDLYVTHQRYVLAATPNVSQRTLVEAYSTRGVTLADGQPATVTGQLAALTASRTQRFAFKPTSHVDGHDVAVHNPLSYVARLRVGFTAALTQGPAVLEVSAFDVRGTGDFEVTSSYADPFPSEWLRYVFTQPLASWNYAARGALRATTYTSGAFDRVAATPDLTIAAAVAPPHEITVAGLPTKLAAAVAFDGMHAVAIQWAPVTGVSHYRVTANRVVADAEASKLTLVATFDTTEPRAAMPASLFTVGEPYMFAVSAIADPTVDYAGGTLVRSGLPFRSNEAVTARLVLATSCGNGVVDAAYEQCDGGGKATATCNPDCTTPVCGDGFANAAAGEACDNAGLSLRCSATCTVIP